MKHRGILLDIDNTLYSYEQCHEISIKRVFQHLKESSVQVENLENIYLEAKRMIHIELAETASSHNRLLYFQKMCEILELNPFDYSLKLYNIYWDTFFESMNLFDGVEDFFNKVSSTMQICFVTDLTAHIQYRKIDRLGLSKYVNHIVTSEEAGKEKPHPYIFLSALKKLNLQPSEVLMIGDNFKKDVVGASNLGIEAIWVNHEQKQEKYNNQNISEVTMFKEILELACMK